MMKAWKQKNTNNLYDIQSQPNPLPAEYDPAEWELVEVSEADIAAQYPPSREIFLQRLNDDLHAYLVEKGYDESVQLSFQAIYMDLLEKQVTGQAKHKIRDVFDFIMKIVLPWYYTQKAELEKTEDYLTYSWDFHLLDEHDPGVSLREIMELLA
jgi:hypothetical protein